MSLQYNFMHFAGHVARDPQLRYLGNKQTPVANFAVASNRRFKDSAGDLVDEVCFLEVEAWRETADFIGKYISKGAAVLVVGRLKQDHWTDKDGNKRSSYRLVADRVLFTDSKAKRDDAGAPAVNVDTSQGGPGPAQPVPAAASDDQPPF